MYKPIFVDATPRLFNKKEYMTAIFDVICYKASAVQTPDWWQYLK